jgi:hypothetical protein
MGRKELPRHRDMVANIVDTYNRATLEQRESGRRWYPLAGRIVEHIAAETRTDAVRVAYALAALSPRNPWRWNVADAYSFAEARQQGRTMPRATTFKRNQESAWLALSADTAPWCTAAPKVNAFVAAIMGNPLSVVVDVWAIRVAIQADRKTITLSDYVDIAEAYKDAARSIGEQPAHIQAITWLVAQTEGLATHRRGRPDLSFKAGTPDLVRSMFE